MMSLLDGSGMTGDIWSTGAFAVDSPLKDLLDSGDFTIEQLLAEDELLQELRGLHPQLLDYFSTEEAVSALVRYLIIDTSVPVPKRPESTDAANDKKDQSSGEEETAKPPEPGKWLFQHLEEIRSNADKNPEAVPENLYIRFPYMACEIICCELKGIIDVLVDGYVPPETQKTSSPVGTQQQPDAEEESKTQHPETEEGEEKQGRQRILDLLFSVLYDTAPGDLDDYRAGYLEKILSVLFRKRPQALSDYLDNGGGRGKVTLMKAMFKHLYSHSIMQLVQRLLLPQPPHLQQKTENDENKQGNKEGEGDDEEDDGNLVLEAAPGSLIVEDADDETKTFQCSWSESEEALDLLLQPLIYPDSSLSPEMELVNGHKTAISVEDKERRLNLCQNASEVLITIIQNSPLNTNTMLRLTVDPILGKLVDRASTLKDGEEFGPHESNLTAAMNVLESLILQLGGYGSVGTISLLPTEEGVEGADIEMVPPPRFADLQTLLTHIPRMLDSVSKLLLHPACDDWRSPMQYSKSSEPQLLLGMSRLRIVRLLESLVLLGESNVDTLLCRSDCLQICLDLFWKFQWCSMLHQSVANLLVHVFEGANARSEMQKYFLVKCNLLGRLMDSFSEVSVGEAGYILRNNAPVSDQAAAVIGMKSFDIDEEKSPSTEAQSPSQEERIPVSDDDIDSALEQAEAQRGADEMNAAAAMADLAGSNNVKRQPNKASETSSLRQISTEPVSYESRDASVGPMLDRAPAQSFRMGYMGHVIIICQALIHACSADEANDEMQGQSTNSTAQDDADDAEQRQSLLALSDTEDSKKMNGEHHACAGEEGEEDAQLISQHSLISENEDEEVLAGRDDGESARGVDSNAEGIPPPNPLILSKIIDSHQLSSRWREFVRTTLASETAIQSTPLGGFNNNVGGDPLHAHRPLGGDEFDDDGSGQVIMPPRGMLDGGDVIDMDDNDLDIAASMMAGLRLARDGDDDHNNEDGNDSSDDEESDGSGNTYDSGRNSAKGGYFFDDPLGGGGKSGLGLALGNLGQYHANGSGSDEDNNSSGGSDDGDGSDQSSDDEKDEPRTMNLFAGNMDRGSDQPEASPLDDTTWSNFANFDDAFASESDEGRFPSSQTVFLPADPSFSADFGAAEIQKPSDEDPIPSPPSGPATEAIDEIFGAPKTHAILLDYDEGTRPKMKILPDEKLEDATNDTAQAVPEDDEENSETSGN